MSKKFYLVYDNGENQGINLSRDEVTIKGRNIRILKADFLSEAEIGQINADYDDMIQRKRKFRFGAAIDATIDQSPYIAVFAYIVVFSLGSMINPNAAAIVGMAMALFSVLQATTNVMKVKRKGMILFFNLAVGIMISKVLSYIIPAEINVISSIIELLLLLVSFFPDIANEWKKSYRSYCCKDSSKMEK